MMYLKSFFIIFLFSFNLDAKESGKKEDLAKNQKIKKAYLAYCETRVTKEKYSLKKAKEICQCAMKNILNNGTIEDVYLLSKKSPKKLTEKTEAEKIRNKKWIELSNLDVHSLDDCSRGVSKQ